MNIFIVDNPSCGRTLESNESILLEGFCSDCYDLFRDDAVRRTKLYIECKDFRGFFLGVRGMSA